MAALATTTLNGAVATSATRVCLAGTTALTSVGLWLFVDGEAMQTLAAPDGSGNVAVQRGLGGTRVSPHATADTVYIGTSAQFYQQDPIGVPPTWPDVTPWINLLTGGVWNSVAGAWALTAGSGMGTGTGLEVFQTSPTLITPSFTAASGSFSSFTASATAATIRTDSTTAHTMVIQGYDVDGTGYKTFVTVTNGNTPDCTISAPSGGTLAIDATTYKAGGTSGATAGPFTVVTAIEVKNGLVITLTGS